jgi:hypothetical protein
MSFTGAMPLSTGVGIAGGFGSVCQISSARAAPLSHNSATTPISSLLMNCLLPAARPASVSAKPPGCFAG